MGVGGYWILSNRWGHSCEGCLFRVVSLNGCWCGDLLIIAMSERTVSHDSSLFSLLGTS